ncbi:MAG: hypothetical protein IAI50_04735 [Candidatus Eremiobacteraeota bacterium]|nr:hypothetical protein [Candidatus Eremiobacteraeota bacterium]
MDVIGRSGNGGSAATPAHSDNDIHGDDRIAFLTEGAVSFARDVLFALGVLGGVLGFASHAKLPQFSIEKQLTERPLTRLTSVGEAVRLSWPGYVFIVGRRVSAVLAETSALTRRR